MAITTFETEVGVPEGMDAEEWRLRCDLAGA